MKAAFPLYCQILALSTLLLIPFSEACEYCGNTPCTCAYCEICKEKPCGCVHSKEPHQSAPGQPPTAGEAVPAIMKTILEKVDYNQKIAISLEGGVHFSSRPKLGPSTGQPLPSIEEEFEKNNENTQDMDVDTAVSIIAYLLQGHHCEEHFSSINETIMSLLGSLVWVMASENIQDLRASHSKVLELQEYRLCGLSSLAEAEFWLLKNSLKKFLNSSKYSFYYIFSVQFSYRVNVSLFFHTMPDASGVAIFFQGQFYMLSKRTFKNLVITLLNKKETTHIALDEIKKGASIDPEDGYINKK